jgi:hypothetical protein
VWVIRKVQSERYMWSRVERCKPTSKIGKCSRAHLLFTMIRSCGRFRRTQLRWIVTSRVLVEFTRFQVPSKQNINPALR